MFSQFFSYIYVSTTRFILLLCHCFFFYKLVFLFHPSSRRHEWFQIVIKHQPHTLYILITQLALTGTDITQLALTGTDITQLALTALTLHSWQLRY